jgi:hypothetical protein
MREGERRRRRRRTRRKRGGGNQALEDVIRELERPWTRGFFPQGLNGPHPSPRDDDWTGEGGGGGSKKRTGITRGPPKKEGGKVKHSPTAPPRIPKPANDNLTPPRTPVIAITCCPACPCQSLAVAIAADDIVATPLLKFIDERQEAMNEKKKGLPARIKEQWFKYLIVVLLRGEEEELMH